MEYTIKLTIEYDGTNYYGWQKQKDLPTIQGAIEKAVSEITGEPTHVIASGRTDAGVHALGQVAHFRSTLHLSENAWIKAINSRLPHDIAIRDAEYVSAGFHARFSARKRIYRYVILNHKYAPVFVRRYVWHIPYSLDVSLMKRASRFLTGTKDFSSFRASSCTAPSPVITVERIDIEYSNAPPFPFLEGNMYPFIVFSFEARSFLHHMVRNIVGTLKEVGEGKIDPDYVKFILDQKDRRLASPTAPPQGLFLAEVLY